MITGRFGKPLMIGAAATLAVAGMGMYVWKEEHRPHVLEIYVFALKTGRSVFIRTPEDKRILIDGGGDADIVREITRILPFYSRRIDTIISTGTDGKNVSGLIDIISRYAVDRAYIPAITLESLHLASSTDPIYSTFLDTLNKAKIPVHEAKAGDSISFDRNVSANVIFPASSTDFIYSKASAPELLLQISYGTTSMALLGDATKKAQKYIASTTIASSDVLYISQSAAPDSLSGELMNALNPGYLIYSKVVSNAAPRLSKAAASKGKSSVKKKETIDLLAGISDENRFNLKESGSALIVSNGDSIEIKKAP